MLKILYTILSCNRYIEERCISSENTWLKQINKNSDYVILTANSDKPKIYSTNTPDNYTSNAYKWLFFLQNYDFKDYQWIFSIDDDNFVFPDRLERYIHEKNFDNNKKLAIGPRHCEFTPLNDIIFCGGGGILISSNGIRSLKHSLLNIDSQNHDIYGGHDQFLFDMFKKLDFEIIDANENIIDTKPFLPDKFNCPSISDIMRDKCISLHYCNSDDKKLLYEKYYK